jgi:hypothetical protein
MVDVVTVEEAGVHTTRKATALIPALQCTIDRGRNDAGFASEVERFAVLGLPDRDNSTVAGDTPYGFSGKNGSVLQLRRIIRVNGTLFG